LNSQRLKKTFSLKRFFLKKLKEKRRIMKIKINITKKSMFSRKFKSHRIKLELNTGVMHF